ncbi:hypothetical protein D3C76_1666350 [compost metagenome]
MQSADSEQGQTGREINPHRARQQEGRATFGQQPRVDLRHQNEARRIGTEQPAEMLGRNAVELDDDEG